MHCTADVLPKEDIASFSYSAEDLMVGCDAIIEKNVYSRIEEVKNKET